MIKNPVIVFAYRDVGFECLDVLLTHGVHVVAVFTHTNDPNENIWFPSVAALARSNNIPVYTPRNINTREWITRIHAFDPDLILSFYYRNLLAPEILQIARLGAFNIHGSLLPKYRGCAPVNWAILNGERETGATLHTMVQRPDAGDIVDQQSVTIGPEETAGAVSIRVAAAARIVLERQLDNLLTGRAPRYPQDETQATYYGKRVPDDGRIDWRLSATEIFNRIRALTKPYPGAFTDIDNQRLIIWRARPRASTATQRPGRVISTDPLLVATGENYLEVLEWQWMGESTRSHGGNQRLRTGLLLDAQQPIEGRV